MTRPILEQLPEDVTPEDRLRSARVSVSKLTAAVAAASLLLAPAALAAPEPGAPAPRPTAITQTASSSTIQAGSGGAVFFILNNERARERCRSEVQDAAQVSRARAIEICQGREKEAWGKMLTYGGIGVGVLAGLAAMAGAVGGPKPSRVEQAGPARGSGPDPDLDL